MFSFIVGLASTDICVQESMYCSFCIFVRNQIKISVIVAKITVDQNGTISVSSHAFLSVSKGWEN